MLSTQPDAAAVKARTFGRPLPAAPLYVTLATVCHHTWACGFPSHPSGSRARRKGTPPLLCTPSRHLHVRTCRACDTPFAAMELSLKMPQTRIARAAAAAATAVGVAVKPDTSAAADMVFTRPDAYVLTRALAWRSRAKRAGGRHATHALLPLCLIA
ncbi:MAG: hypothetical protein EOO65_00475 [Methanosarcinales archaeon]|nr:MAG: hypothetical protein EOO65_00475 [Methanosarcinales archaeon]